MKLEGQKKLTEITKQIGSDITIASKAFRNLFSQR